MKDKMMDRWSTYEPFYVVLGDKKVADIIITNHARVRWADRVESEKTGFEDICSFLWDRLKKEEVHPYYKNEKDVFVIDEDLVMVAEFSVLENEFDIAGNPLHKMIVVTFLGRMSEVIELRDLKSYYSWLRHSRRMTLIKNSRKRK
ncbi:MAG: periplasmic protein [Paenibacillus sp.]|nr:periplasmic protein [Paenibacillus sp.]MDF2815205.1 periplasmic protein [Paenibacillus sp.]